MNSFSVSLYPCDSRCRYWAKIIRKGQSLPLPADVNGANDIPGKYLRGDEELLPGDVLFEGEAMHHRKNRGWHYVVQVVTEAGELRRFVNGAFSNQKAQMKAQGMSPDYLRGAGDVAAMVRIAHGIRLGLEVRSDEDD
ncbi:hypothetical protein [Derxia lacustris]|uniref:hypothetical protein n=1 Tax=Derxia lacustris TaxID=764842 RepID=UPI00111C615F|nr:hypothetical protein [Derxia lacustris]